VELNIQNHNVTEDICLQRASFIKFEDVDDRVQPSEVVTLPACGE
jgi:hypothetical protein